MSKIVLCDLDGIVADLQGKLIEVSNRDHGTDMKRSDVDDWQLTKCFSIGEKVWDYVGADGWFDDLEPLAGAVSGLAQLHDAGLKVVVLTSATNNPNSAAEKKRWAAKHLPFIKRRHVMVGALKHLVRGDFFIDDSPAQQKAYRKAWPDSTILTIKYEFPADKGVDVQAESYKDTSEAWDIIVKEVLARIA